MEALSNNKTTIPAILLDLLTLTLVPERLALSLKIAKVSRVNVQDVVVNTLRNRLILHSTNDGIVYVYLISTTSMGRHIPQARKLTTQMRINKSFWRLLFILHTKM